MAPALALRNARCRPLAPAPRRRRRLLPSPMQLGHIETTKNQQRLMAALKEGSSALKQMQQAGAGPRGSGVACGCSGGRAAGRFLRPPSCLPPAHQLPPCPMPPPTFPPSQAVPLAEVEQLMQEGADAKAYEDSLRQLLGALPVTARGQPP